MYSEPTKHALFVIFLGGHARLPVQVINSLLTLYHFTIYVSRGKKAELLKNHFQLGKLLSNNAFPRHRYSGIKKMFTLKIVLGYCYF